MSVRAPHAGRSRIVVERVHSLEDLEPIFGEWDDLLARSEIDGFFASSGWCRAWLEATADEYEMFVLTARDDERRLIGVAPLAIARATLQLEFVGQSFWGEYLGFLLDPRHEDEAAEALCAAIARAHHVTWTRARFRFVGADSRFETLLLEHCARHGVTLCETNIEAAPFVALPTDIRDYYASKTTHFTKRIEYIERRLAKEGAVELKIAGEEIGAFEAIEIFWQLYAMRWESHDRTFETFQRAFAVDLVDRGEALIAILFVAGKPVAARYDLVFAGKVWSYLGGWDPEWSRFEVGNVLIGRLLAIAIARGQREYDFLAGDADYKRRWGTGVRAMVDLVDVSTLAGDPDLAEATEALGEIDGLAFLNADASEADPSGERRVVAGCRAVVSGWIAMSEPPDGDLTAFACLGDRRYVLSYGLTRTDVARALGDETRELTGFQGVFRVTDLAPGAYDLCVGVASLDGRTVAVLPTRFAVTIESSADSSERETERESAAPQAQSHPT